MNERVPLRYLLAPALAQLANVTRPSCERVILGLVHDLDRVPSFDQGWARLCSAAWSLGLAFLRIEPTSCSNLQPKASGKWVSQPDDLEQPVTFELSADGVTVATLRVWPGPRMRPFDLESFASAVEGLVSRFAAGN